MTRWPAFSFSIICALGCSDGDPDTDGSSGELLPWKEGNSWTYKVTDNNGTVTTKTTTIMGLEAVGGMGPNAAKQANKVVTEKDDGADETHSWQSALGDKVVRYRELSFDMAGGVAELEEYWDPYKLRVDKSPDYTTAGKSWVEMYSEAKIDAHTSGAPAPASRRDIWTVLKDNEKVTVPQGEFNAVVLQRTSGSDSAKQYFFVRGVGKVKETGSGQTEELVSYSLE